jgi:hypothetical protein
MKGVVSAMEYTAASFNYLFNFNCNIDSKIQSEEYGDESAFHLL